MFAVIMTVVCGALAYLVVGALLAHEFFTRLVPGGAAIEDASDYVMLGVITLISPVALPFALVFYTLGRISAKFTGLGFTSGETDG